MDVAPDGRAFYSGPDQTMRKLDTAGGGTWQTFGQRDAINRSYGSHAIYDIGKTLVAGGGASSNDARVIDINGATPQVSRDRRRWRSGAASTTSPLLADGSVLATGGNSTGASLIDMNGGVYNAELWDPATGQWKTLAAKAVTRQYHSTALLLPGRAGAVRRRRNLRHLRPGRLPGQERRDLHAAVPVQEGRLG